MPNIFRIRNDSKSLIKRIPVAGVVSLGKSHLNYNSLVLSETDVKFGGPPGYGNMSLSLELYSPNRRFVCYKYLTGIYNIPNDILPKDNKTITRGHSLKLAKPTAQNSVRQNFFSVRVVNAWNSLPEKVISASSLNAFKNELDKVWSRHKFSLSSEWFRAPPRSEALSYP